MSLARRCFKGWDVCIELGSVAIYGGGKIYLDGQTVKTKIFTKELA